MKASSSYWDAFDRAIMTPAYREILVRTADPFGRLESFGASPKTGLTKDEGEVMDAALVFKENGWTPNMGIAKYPPTYSVLESATQVKANRATVLTKGEFAGKDVSTLARHKCALYVGGLTWNTDRAHPDNTDKADNPDNKKFQEYGGETLPEAELINVATYIKDSGADIVFVGEQEGFVKDMWDHDADANPASLAEKIADASLDDLVKVKGATGVPTKVMVTGYTKISAAPTTTRLEAVEYANSEWDFEVVPFTNTKGEYKIEAHIAPLAKLHPAVRDYSRKTVIGGKSLVKLRVIAKKAGCKDVEITVGNVHAPTEPSTKISTMILDAMDGEHDYSHLYSNKVGKDFHPGDFRMVMGDFNFRMFNSPTDAALHTLPNGPWDKSLTDAFDLIYKDQCSIEDNGATYVGVKHAKMPQIGWLDRTFAKAYTPYRGKPQAANTKFSLIYDELLTMNKDNNMFTSSDHGAVLNVYEIIKADPEEVGSGEEEGDEDNMEVDEDEVEMGLERVSTQRKSSSSSRAHAVQPESAKVAAVHKSVENLEREISELL